MTTTPPIVTIVIRNARAEEMDDAAALLKNAYKEYESLMPPGACESYLEDITDVRSRLAESDPIVAELDGRLAGAVTLYTRTSTSLNWPSGWASVRLLGVHPAYRGRGIAHLLMQECIRRCRARGITAVGLHTTEAMGVARRIYEEMGFARVPEYDYRPAPGVVVMAYRLDLTGQTGRH
jgi:ribosomal protein S18 acetylase RimI-like enzyme